MITYNYDNEMVNILNDINSIDLYKNGTKTSFALENKEFKTIIEKLKDIFIHTRLMPAYGVSLDEMVKEELKKDSWLELKFSKEQNINSLPFDKLLFKLEECYGFNLIRNYNGSYDGRCLFLDLDTLTNLNDIIN